MIKKIYILTFIFALFNSSSYAEKIECDLLSPIQKAIYKAYCKAEAKKNAKSATSIPSENKVNTSGDKAKSLLKSIGGKIKLNTDSTLFKTGKHAEK